MVNIITKYTITQKHLIIKCGIFCNKTINIDQIKWVAKSSDWSAWPAPSFDRIEIAYSKFETIVISPKDKFGFANDLCQMNPLTINILKY